MPSQPLSTNCSLQHTSSNVILQHWSSRHDIIPLRFIFFFHRCSFATNTSFHSMLQHYRNNLSPSLTLNVLLCCWCFIQNNSRMRIKDKSHAWQTFAYNRLFIIWIRLIKYMAHGMHAVPVIFCYPRPPGSMRASLSKNTESK